MALDGRSLLVAVAATPQQRSRGLMGIADLGPVDGMLFVFEDAETTSTFWMKDTLIPLDIGFFDGDGVLLGTRAMEPCVADPCPRYTAPAPYRWALETAAGGFEGVASGATLTGAPG